MHELRNLKATIKPRHHNDGVGVALLQCRDQLTDPHQLLWLIAPRVVGSRGDRYVFMWIQYAPRYIEIVTMQMNVAKPQPPFLNGT